MNQIERFVAAYTDEEQITIIEGIDAHIMGKGYSDNPYKEGTKKFQLWYEGITYAKHLELP